MITLRSSRLIYVFSLLLSLAMINCTTAQSFKNEILGKWQIVSHTSRMGNEDVVKKYENKENEPHLEFTKDNVLKDLRSGEEYNYSILDSIITLGNRTYIIESMSSELMILTETKETAGIILESYHYKKIE